MENLIHDRDNLNDFLEEAELQQYFRLFRDILKVNKVSQLKYVNIDDLIQIGLSKPEQRRFNKIYSKYYPNTYFTKIRKLLSTNKRNEPCSPGHSSSSIELQPSAENSLKVPTKHIISIEDITINKELGMGQFGVVQQGTWTTGNQRLQVAIKCLGHERMTSNSTEFLKEAAVMHSIEHSNIVRLYGVVLHLDSLMLVTELAPLRSLLECLREVSLRHIFSVPILCEFAEQICDGMTYLENKRLIHRDLAARNILVFSKNRVKISDFGLSRALGVGKDYYQTNYNVNLKLPVAWCAPECILYLRFTSASDVWALGVCLWEMFTYGFQPWAAFSGQQILEAIDAPNFQRLERPDCCPEAYYTAMLECWSHDPNKRPKFKDLTMKLRLIRPEQAQATKDFVKPGDCRRSNLLVYKAGQVITVIGKETGMLKPLMWHGVLPNGTCGLFDPDHTKPYVCIEKSITLGSLSPRPTRNSARSTRHSLLRTDRKRHTFTGKQIIHRSMISSPQGDVKHTGHVGLDGAYFGDISFLDPAGCPPRQVVTPYKPSEDLEQVPLINPNSPSHLTGASSALPYPLLSLPGSSLKTNCDEVDLACKESKGKCPKKQTNKSPEPSTSKGILNMVKSATLGRSQRATEDVTFKTDEVHEYHEISDSDTESTTDNAMQEKRPESPGRQNLEFSQSILDEMESMFLNFDFCQPEDPSGPTFRFGMDNEMRSHTLNKIDKKKNFYTGTMKPMSAHDKKTLDTAVALANEITTKSMNDLAVEKLPNSPSDRSKFHFKFPHVSLHHGPQPDADKDAGKQERRNFTEEAKRVSNIQATITEESKLAYISLIEEPTPSTSLITQNTGGLQSADSSQTPNVRSLPKPVLHRMRSPSTEGTTSDDDNEFVLPPRTSKPKLVDKPRHFRKYPLRLPDQYGYRDVNKPIIYQNAITGPVIIRNEVVEVHKVERKGVDVFDGPSTSQCDTNPFKSIGEGSANPFVCYYCKDDSEESDGAAEGGQEQGGLIKDCVDHVSVEDLLEFADHKPCGRQRGVESDEVRIMSKVLQQQATSEECLEALELSDWNVHLAIKLLRVKLAVGNDVPLEDCCEELAKTNGDVVKTSNVLVSLKRNKVE